MSTKYHHLTNAELLRELNDVRQFSPVIEELCTRLHTEAICPVCEADLNEARKHLD